MNTKKIVLISFSSVLIVFCAYLAFMSYKKNELLNKYQFVDTELKQKTDSLLSENTEKNYSPENKLKVKALKQATDSLTGKIEAIKNHLLTISENSNGINDYLFKEKKASELKGDLIRFNNYIKTEFQNMSLNQAGSKINIADIEENGKIITWEDYYFKGMPMAAIFEQLNSLMSSIKVKENEILKQLN